MFPLLTPVLLAVATAFGGATSPYVHSVEASTTDEVGTVDPLADAFAALQRMPAVPHLRTRSRLQADVVQAAIASGRIEDARTWAGSIQNWRQGLALADIAVHFAAAKQMDEALAAIKAAEAFELTITGEQEQGWRRDRVRVRIAEAYALLGDPVTAASIQALTVPSEGGRLAPLSVRTIKDEEIQKHLGTLEEIARTGDLEQIRYSLLAMCELYGRGLAVPAEPAATEKASVEIAVPSSAEVEKRIRAAWTEVPIEPRIQILRRLVELELESGSPERGRVLIEEIAGMVRLHRWNPEQGVSFRADVAKLLAAAGDQKAALGMAHEALELYDSSGEGIVSIFRGKALRPLAEAFVALGDPSTATAVYQRALEEAMVNPNSRPRLTDLVATAVSMETADGYEAPKRLLASFHQVESSIGAPW